MMNFKEKLHSLYALSHKNRISSHHSSLKVPRRIFWKNFYRSFTLIQITFFVLFCYLFGSLYEPSHHVKNLKVLYVDFDGGVVGRSVQAAYEGLKGQGYPTLVVKGADEFESVEAVRNEVCSARYWGGFFVNEGASERLSEALEGGLAAEDYDRNNVMGMVWNQARYPVIADGLVKTNLVKLSTAARATYGKINGTVALRALNTDDQAAVDAFTNPWNLQDINLRKTTQGPRMVYNGICFVLVIIKNFFFLVSINGLMSGSKLYLRLKPHSLVLCRLLISSAYTYVGSLLLTGAIWAFREDWPVSAGQFVLSWMALWLYEDINFFLLDALTAFIPHAFMPLVLISWVVLSVASITMPFELSAGFYKWNYALPAHETYEVLVDIWSGGCWPTLHRSLPILFAWWVVCAAAALVGVLRRAHYAYLEADKEEAAFRKRLEAAREQERRRDKELAAATPGSEEEETAVMEDLKLQQTLRKEEEKLRKLYSRRKSLTYGPAIPPPWEAKADSSSSSLADEKRWA